MRLSGTLAPTGPRVTEPGETAKSDPRPVIGVDIDGVLGDQVTGVLARVEEELGIQLCYEDIVHWDLPIGSDTSFVPEIAKAMLDPLYVQSMRVHAGAPEMLRRLRSKYRVHVLTVRPREVRAGTVMWLEESGLEYDRFEFSKEALKSAHGTEVLIDDYDQNLVEFLSNSEGFGVLVDQPWNQSEDALEPFISAGRLVRVARLVEVPPAVDRFLNL